MIITQFKSLVNVMFRAFTKQYICDNQISIISRYEKFSEHLISHAISSHFKLPAAMRRYRDRELAGRIQYLRRGERI